MEMQRLVYKILVFACIFYCVASGSSNVRLRGSANPWEGIVEVFYNGTWGTICKRYYYSWSRNNADVVCRELGYFRSRGGYWYNYKRQNESVPIWFYGVSCTGKESTLLNCSYTKYSSTGYPRCTHRNDATVKCLNFTRVQATGNCNFEFVDMCNYTNTKGFDETDWILRRGGSGYWGGTPYRDHTLMAYDGHYVTVNDRRARLISPVITSKQCLSFYYNFYGSSYVKTLKVYLKNSTSFPKLIWRLQKSSSSGWNLGKIPLDGSPIQVIFEGEAPKRTSRYSSQGSVSLDDITVSTGHCTLHPEDAKIIYEESSSEIRLVGGTNSSGRVQVFHNKQWGRVCGDYSWDIKEANVVCRYLGFQKAEAALTSDVFGKGKGFILLQRVRCSGIEPSLSQCAHDGWEHVNYCGRYSRGDASVICKTSTDYDIRLNGSSETPYQGKVEVNFGGLWFAVDEQGWDIRDGNVACRQLGYAGAYHVTIADSTSSQKGFSNLKCQGNETSLQQCNHTTMQFWSYRRDAAVTCYGLRLTGGKSEMEGRLEVQYDGVWGTVCNKNWDKKDADVVCRTLGFDQATAKNCCPKFGEGTGPIVVDNAQCNGNEVGFSLCKQRGWGIAKDCTHANDVGVSCEYKIELSKIKIVLKGSPKKWNNTVFLKNLVDVLNKYCSVENNCGNYTSGNKTRISNKDVELSNSKPKYDPLYPDRLMVEIGVRAYLRNGKGVSLSSKVLFNAIKSEKTLAGHEVLFVDNQQILKPHNQQHHSKDNTKSTSHSTIVIVAVFVVFGGLLLISVLIYLVVRRRGLRRRMDELRTQDQAYTALLSDDHEEANADVGELLVPPTEDTSNTAPEA